MSNYLPRDHPAREESAARAREAFRALVPASEYDALIDLFLWLAKWCGKREHEIEFAAQRELGDAEAAAIVSMFNGWRAAEFFDV